MPRERVVERVLRVASGRVRYAAGVIAMAYSLLGFAHGAEAQRWPRVEPEEAAHARRDADFARATGLTAEQARTVFAQMMYPPHAPRARSVVDETRPDGTRNVFALLDFDPIAECRIEGNSTRECRERPPSLGVQSHILLVQIGPSGQVVRTAVDLAFGTAPRTGGLRRPSTLRLFSPAPGAARVAIVEGSVSAPAARNEYGEREPAEYIHDLYVWDGRHGRSYRVSSHIGDGSLGAVVIDDSAHRILRRSVRCEGACRCRLPRDMETEAAQIARMTGVCAPTEEAIELPAGFHLIDDDLDARTPRLTLEEALAARVPALVQSSGLSQAQAEQVVAARTTLDAPRFGRFVSHVSADGSRELYGIVQTPQFESCVYRQRGRSRYDAVRACAHEDATRGEVLYVRLGADGRVAESRLLWIGQSGVADIHLSQDAAGVFATIEEFQVSDHPGGRMVVHAAIFARGGQPAGREYVTYAIETCRCHDPAQNYAGELIARPAQEPFETLTRRRVACTEPCPCGPLPTAAADAHALIERRNTAENPACRPQEARLNPSTGR